MRLALIMATTCSLLPDGSLTMEVKLMGWNMKKKKKKSLNQATEFHGSPSQD